MKTKPRTIECRCANCARYLLLRPARSDRANGEKASTFQTGGERFSLSPGERAEVRASVRQTFHAAILFSMLLSGCAVGPNYHRPDALDSTPMPAAFGDAAVT